MKRLIIRLIAKMLGTNIYFTNQLTVNPYEPICHLDNDTIRLEGVQYEVKEIKRSIDFWHQTPCNDHAAIEFFRQILKTKEFNEWLEFDRHVRDVGYGERVDTTMRVLVRKKQ